MGRVVLHSDLNSFYASVEVLYNPALRGKPVSVCGSTDDRHGIVLASTSEAKRYGVKTGDAVWQARQKCPGLVVVEPHMDRYVRFSKMARDIYAEFSPCVEPFGLDECWLDLTGTEGVFGDPVETASRIRRMIQEEMGVTASIGVSFNKTMSKLGSDYKKPDATTVITRENFKQVVWPMPVSNLLYVGRATAHKLRGAGINTIGRLAQAPQELLLRRLGINGLMLWRFANGIDDTPVGEIGWTPPVKSIGNSTTSPRDLRTVDDVKMVAMMLAESVAERMREQYFKCRTVQVYIRYHNLEWYQRQAPLPYPSCTAHAIGSLAIQLILDHWDGAPLRSLGVRGCRLVSASCQQQSLLQEEQEDQRQENLEMAMQDIRRRFGHFSVRRGLMLTDSRLSDLDTRDHASVQSVAFFKG